MLEAPNKTRVGGKRSGGKDEEGYKDENGRSLRDEKYERKEGETEGGRLNRQKYKITHISGGEYGGPHSPSTGCPLVSFGGPQ